MEESKVTGETSDGYHTFNELYEHRHLLLAAVAKAYKASWKSKLHDDGTMFDGWFIVGITNCKGQDITYHIPIRLWKLFKCKAFKKAPKWDGHTSKDALERLKWM